jgi:hypothetical protein
MDYGMCDVCGRPVTAGSSFINTGPTDWSDPSKPKTQRWVPADEDMHGRTPFVMTHPACFVSGAGVASLVALVDESHGLMRRRVAQP